MLYNDRYVQYRERHSTGSRVPEGQRASVHTHTRHKMTSCVKHCLCVLVNALHGEHEADEKDVTGGLVCSELLCLYRYCQYRCCQHTLRGRLYTVQPVEWLTCPSGRHRPNASSSRGVAMTVVLKSLTQTLPSPLTSCTHTCTPGHREGSQGN